MPAFHYQALDPQGQTQNGVLEGDSERAVRQLLRKRSLIPLRVELVSKTSNSILHKELWKSRVFSSTDLTLWTRQLAELIKAGLPLERALNALAGEADNPNARDLVASIRSEVNAGATFAKALEPHPREFSAVYRASIAAGEQSGELGLVLTRLASDLEAQNQLQSKVLQALLYPAIVSLIALFIVLFLLTYVVPQVAHVFTSSQHQLPLLTTVMLTVSSFLLNEWWVLCLALASGLYASRQALKNERIKARFDAWLLLTPIVGPLVRGYNAARFANTLATLVGAGVPILKALQSCCLILSNQAMKDDMLQALVMVREGAPLGLALGERGRMPGMLPMFARLGEQTGRLPEMLERAAEQLSSDVQRKALQLATILEPLLIVAMGAMVMLIVLSIMMPIIELNQLVK
jgi:general secretion pathway protein F